MALPGFAQKAFLPSIFLAQRRKGAKRCRVFGGFLCAFAPLREKYSCHRCALGLFVQRPAMVDPTGLKPALHGLKGRCSVTRAPDQEPFQLPISDCRLRKAAALI